MQVFNADRPKVKQLPQKYLIKLTKQKWSISEKHRISLVSLYFHMSFGHFPWVADLCGLSVMA